MAVWIAHASKDERNKATGGTAGDQTGKEVKISNWYDGGWTFVARAKDPAVAEIIAAAAKDGCENENIGYDQSGRNTLMTEAKKWDFDLSRIDTPCEADCSSFVSVCVRAALGRDFWSGNAPTTATMKKVLEGTDSFEILTDEKYLTSDAFLRSGDILNRPGKHVAIAVQNGAGEALYPVRLPVLKRGSRGDSVRAMQALLSVRGYGCGKSGIDGDFGADTDRALLDFQRGSGLEADGKCGPKTWAALLT